MYRIGPQAYMQLESIVGKSRCWKVFDCYNFPTSIITLRFQQKLFDVNLSKFSIFQLAFPTACVPVHVKWYLFFPECESIVLNDMEGHQRLIKPFLVEVFSVLLWLKSLHFRYHLYFRYSSLLTVFHSKILLFQVFCGIFIQ